MSRKEIIPEFPKELAQYIAVVAVALAGVLFATVFLGFAMQDIVLVGALLLAAVASRIPQHFAPTAWPVELVTLATFVCALKYSPLAGALMGTAAFGISRFFTIERPQDVIVAMLGMVAVAFLAPQVYGLLGSYALAGLVIVLVYDIGTGLFYALTGHNIVSCLKFSIIHIPVTYLVIKYAAPVLMQ